MKRYKKDLKNITVKVTGKSTGTLILLSQIYKWSTKKSARRWTRKVGSNTRDPRECWLDENSIEGQILKHYPISAGCNAWITTRGAWVLSTLDVCWMQLKGPFECSSFWVLFLLQWMMKPVSILRCSWWT